MKGFVTKESTCREELPSHIAYEGEGYTVEHYMRNYEGLQYSDWIADRLSIYIRTISPDSPSAPHLTTHNNNGPTWNGTIPKKQLMILPAGCELKSETSGDGISNYTALYLDNRWLYHEASKMLDASNILFDARYIAEDELLSGLISGLLQHNNQSQLLGTSYTDTLLSCICMHLIQNHSNASKIIDRPKGGMAQFMLKRIKDHINDNLTTQLSLDEISTLCNMSTFHMARSFKQETGDTIHNYIIKRRVERATELLKTTDKSITCVAYEVGYSRPATMNHNFLSVLGLSPRDYRKIAG